MTQSKSWLAMIPTATVVIREASFEHRKKGAIGTVKLLAGHPVLGPFVERLGNDQMKAGSGLSRAAVEKAFAEVTADAGTGAGTLAIELAQVVTKVATDLVLDVAVISADERDDFALFVESWDIGECLEFVSSFLKLNFPATHGPFVQLAAKARLNLMQRLSRLETRLKTGEPSESTTSETPGATTAPAPAAVPVAAAA